MGARDHHRGTLKVFRFLITSSMYQVDFFFNSFSFVSSDFKTGDFIFICHLLFKILSQSRYLLLGLLRCSRYDLHGSGVQAPVTGTFEFAFSP